MNITDHRWVPEGPWDDYGPGHVRYLRGESEGGLEIRFDGMRPGATVRVLPDGIHKGRSRGQFVREVLLYAGTVNRIHRLNGDDKAAWLVGALWSKGLRGLEYHVDLAHRIG